jgi:Ribosomal protein S18
LAGKSGKREGNSDRSSSRKRLAPSGPGRRKSCFFCKTHVDEVDYKNVNELRRYVRSAARSAPAGSAARAAAISGRSRSR